MRVMVPDSLQDTDIRCLALPVRKGDSWALPKVNLSELAVRPIFKEGKSPFIFMADTLLAIALFGRAYKEGILPFLGEFNNPEASSEAARLFCADSAILDLPGYMTLAPVLPFVLSTTIILTEEEVSNARSLPEEAHTFLWHREVGAVASWCHMCDAFHLTQEFGGEILHGELLLTRRRDLASSLAKLRIGVAAEQVRAVPGCRLADSFSFRNI